MWKRVTSAGVVVLVLAGSMGLATVAAAQGDAQCTIEIPDVVVDPGLSTEPNSGVFHTNIENGTIDCGRGRTGTIGVDGRYGTADPDSCQGGGEGWGVFSVTLDGKHWKDTFTFKFGPTSKSVLAGEVAGERISGKYTFTGTEGNCVSSPITKGAVKLLATLKG